MAQKSHTLKDCYFAFTVDVEPDIPYRVNSYDGLDHLADIISLLAEKNIAGTFLVTGGLALTHPEVIRLIEASGHEVGCHGFDHEPLNGVNPEGLSFPKLSSERIKEIVYASTQAIISAASHPPRSFRAPYLSFNLNSIIILDEMGYTIDSSQWTHADKHRLPYFPLSDAQKTILEVPVPSGAVNLTQPYSMMEPGISGFSLRLAGQDAVRQATRFILDIDRPHDRPRLILFSCHPWEYIPQPSWKEKLPEHFWWHSDKLLHETRSFLEFIEQNYNPRFVTLGQVYELWTQKII